jgi:hypothetical protein
MIVKKNEFIALFLRMIQQNLEKELPDDDFEFQMLHTATEKTIEQLQHIQIPN